MVSISPSKINFYRLKLAQGQLGLALLLSGMLSACAASVPPNSPAPTAAPLTGLALYLPLQDNSVLAYETSEEPGGQGLLTLQVTRKAGLIVELRAGNKSQLLQISAQAVRHVAGGLLLRWPLQAGDTFRGEFATVHVVATDRAIQVPAGSFSACVETLEAMSEGALKQRSSKVFCPNAGLVYFQNEVSNATQALTHTARLKSFGPKLDVFSEPAPKAP